MKFETEFELEEKVKIEGKEGVFIIAAFLIGANKQVMVCDTMYKDRGRVPLSHLSKIEVKEEVKEDESKNGKTKGAEPKVKRVSQKRAEPKTEVESGGEPEDGDDDQEISVEKIDDIDLNMV